MELIGRLGYLAVGTANLKEAVEFYSRLVRLDVTETVGNTAFMTGGREHHWLRLEEGAGNGLKRIGYELTSDEAFAVVRDRLKAEHIEFSEGGDLATERVQRWLRFVDPGGFEVELYHGMVERGVAPDSNGLTIEKFLHAAWAAPEWDHNIDFYQRVLGFKVSDWVADRAGFFRCADRYHHSLVLMRGSVAQFNHFCIQVGSLDDVMRFRNNALRHGAKLRDDVLRHSPSGSISVYLKDEVHGYAVEYCVNHPQLDDDKHIPRILPATPETRDVWQAPLPERAAFDRGSTVTRAWVPGSAITAQPSLPIP
jgi:2,3-dihydroxy-p-cumate/2,3-dihydroxybenzoate 3,4-dioxygenase